MNDRELLELAAKAAGIIHTQYAATDEGVFHDGAAWWNPLTDDGDALRLAVKLQLTIYQYQRADMKFKTLVQDRLEAIEAGEIHNNDPYAATRRAIVRAAAEIGKAAP